MEKSVQSPDAAAWRISAQVITDTSTQVSIDTENEREGHNASAGINI